jgi:hypothetical protein
MDAQYRNKAEARKLSPDVWYKEAQCNWVKVIQRSVIGSMVVGGKRAGAGVSELGFRVLGFMGWRDWKVVEEKGPVALQAWLEETDIIGGLRCPRLLRLFWLLAWANIPV